MARLPSNLFVWVLAPFVRTNDVNLDYYYDFTQSIQEYTFAFEELDIPWKWQQVTNSTYRKVIDYIAEESLKRNIVVINLCDGDEINGAPGINVIKYLNKKGLCYTGAEEYFYRITTSKISMKEAFESSGVRTPTWQVITDNNAEDPSIFKNLGNSLIVKPAVSGGSLGVNIHSVVSNNHELAKQYKKLHDGYHGWNIANGGVIAEQFISGPEFTTLIVGDASQPHACKIYPPVERVFNQNLPVNEKFLSFDRLWEIYEEESPLKNDADFYKYAVPDKDIIHEICNVSLKAYEAVKGIGYCRVDLRLDVEKKILYVLEVNSQCGLSDDEDFTSIGAILRLSDYSFSSLILSIIKEAFLRKGIPEKQSRNQLATT